MIKNRVSNIQIIIPTLNNSKGIIYLKNYFKGRKYTIDFIDNSKNNLGFAGGVNKGANKSKTKWFLILNDDIVFQDQKLEIKNQKHTSNIKIGNTETSETIEYLIKFAEASKLDAVTPVLINQNGDVENYGYKLLPKGKIQLVKEFSFFNSQFSMNDSILNFQKETDGITAACLLIKTDVFRKLNGFDERFFAYLEDVDFFIRFKKAGYKMGLAYDIKVIHHHMTTSKTMGNFKARQDMINWWRLYFKHPWKFKFNVEFLLERLRNISGFIKATLKNYK